MKNRLAKIAFGILFAATAVGGVGKATAGESDTGTYGAPFVNFPVGAKLTASTDIVAAMDPDASLLFSNPAFLTGVSSYQVFFSTSNWLDDLRLTSISTAIPVGRGLVLSLGSGFLYSGGLQGYDDALNVVEEESYYDVSLIGGVSKQIGAGLSVGLSGTYLRQHLLPDDGDGYALTAGASFQRGKYIAHAVARNLAGKVSFQDAEYDVDREEIVGLGRIFDAGWGSLHAGVQMVWSTSAPARLEMGANYRFHTMFSVRTALKDVSGEQSDLMGLDAGFGVRYQKVAFEYAFTPREYFSGTHTFSLCFTPGDGGTPSYGSNEISVSAAPPTPAATSPTPTSTPPARVVSKPLPATPQTKPVAAAAPAVKPAVRYVVLAGTHGWESSARAEARSLELVGIPAAVETIGGTYRVVIGVFDTRAAAMSAIRKHDKSGLKFRLVEESRK